MTIVRITVRHCAICGWYTNTLIPQTHPIKLNQQRFLNELTLFH